MKIIPNVIASILGKVYGNYWLTGEIVVCGFFLATSNLVTFILYTIFVALDTVDVWTGKFSHNKVEFDRWSIGVTGSFLFTLLFWFIYFSSEDHDGIGTLDFMGSFSEKVLIVIYCNCAVCIIVFIVRLLSYIGKKLWAYLNRWQQ